MPVVAVVDKVAQAVLVAKVAQAVLVVVVNTPQLKTLALDGMGASTATIPASQTPSVVVLTAWGTKVMTNTQALIATTTAAPTAGNVRTAVETAQLTPTVDPVDPVVLVVLVVAAAMVAADVATTRLVITVQQVLPETPVAADQVVLAAAQTLDLVAPVAQAVPVAQVVPAETAVTGDLVVVPGQPVDLVVREALVDLAVTATAPTVLAVAPEVVVLLDLVDPVVERLEPISLTVDHFLSLIMVL